MEFLFVKKRIQRVQQPYHIIVTLLVYNWNRIRCVDKHSKLIIKSCLQKTIK